MSQGLDLLCTLLTRSGDTILVQSPVYHLALRIFRDHGLDLAPVASDESGLRVDDLAATLDVRRIAGRTPRFLYLVPTFCNPTGISLIAQRRAEVVRLAEAHGLLILEDDVYRELWYDLPPPVPLQSLAASGTVIRLGSFSKILAPGLRLGWLIAAPEMVARYVNSGLLDSGGGVNHFTAHVAAAYLDLGLLDGHIERLRTTYRSRRDALLDGLARFMPSDCRWTAPGGGFFRLGAVTRRLRQRGAAPYRGAGRRFVCARRPVLRGRRRGALSAAGVQPAAGGGVGRGRAAVEGGGRQGNLGLLMGAET